MSVNNIGCSPDAGYRLPITCIYGQGGVDELYLIRNTYLTAYSLDANDKIISLSYSAGQMFWKYELIDVTANYDEKENEDAKTGAISWTQNLNVIFSQNTSKLRKQLLQIIKANDLTGIYKDNNARYWLIGKDNFLKVDAVIQTGTNLLDLNGQKLQINGIEPQPAYEVIGSAITYSTVYISGGFDAVSQTTPSTI